MQGTPLPQSSAKRSQSQRNTEREDAQTLVIFIDRKMCVLAAFCLGQDECVCVYVCVPVAKDCICDLLPLGSEGLVWWPLFSQIRSPH